MARGRPRKAEVEVDPSEYRPQGAGGVCPYKSKIVDEIIEKLEREDAYIRAAQFNLEQATKE